MNKQAALKIGEYIYRNSITPVEFQDWLFSDKTDKHKVDKELYDFLIQQDYRSFDSKYSLRDFIHAKDNLIRSIHLQDILDAFER